MTPPPSPLVDTATADYPPPPVLCTTRGRRNNTTQQRAQQRGQQRRDASQATGDDEIRHIDEADASSMRRSRATDSIDILDVVSETITSCVSQLTDQ